MNPSPSHADTVTSLYLAFYGRPADPAGLKYWSQVLADQDGAPGAIIQAFAQSEEAQVRFGSERPVARIAEIYQQLFNRAPDEAGLAWWVAAVEQGRSTLAEVALAVLEGAQGSDAQLLALRQQAAADFTDRVEKIGSDYGGYAAIEAGRVLVRAVTADASARDVARAVDAAVSLADTASNHAFVIASLGLDDTLQALFGGARGRADPVALVEALALVGEGGARNPAMLELLLQGEGMAGVLAALPARLSLQDLVDALAAGGLAGAIGLVYPGQPGTPTPQPPEPPEPPQSLDIAFDSVKQGSLDKVIDHVTNIQDADIVFSIDGALRAGQHAEYRIGGGAWSTAGVEPGVTTIVIRAPDLTLAAAPGGAAVELRIMDAVHGEIASASHDIVLDLDLPGIPALELAVDSGIDAEDGITNVGRVLVEGLDADPGTRWEYSLNAGGSWLPGGANDLTGMATLDLSAVVSGSVSLLVRQIDAAGNARQSAPLAFTHDKTAPGEGLVYRGIVGEPDGALVTDQARVDVAFRVTSRDDGIVQWRLKGELEWTGVGPIAGDGGFTLRNIDLALADPTIELRVIDAAGNVGAAFLETRIDGPYSPFTVTLSPEGLWIESTVAGVIRIGNQVVRSSDSGGGAIDGRVLVAAQALTASGALTVTPDGGTALRDPSGRSYVLGSSGPDNPLSGQYVWSFGDKDTLVGTTGSDYLVGGPAGDLISLRQGGQGNTLAYASGDALTGTFFNGGPVGMIDRITGAVAGDVIQLGALFSAAPVIQDGYLGSSVPGQVAIVRGTINSSAFLSGPSGTDFMLQWTDANGINSIVFDDYAGRRMGLTFDIAAGSMTLTDPPPAPAPLSAYTGFSHALAYNAASLTLRGNPDNVVAAPFADGLLDPAGLELIDYTFRSPPSDVTDTYSSRPGFGVKADGRLDLGGTLDAGVYLLRWNDATFATASGALGKNAIMFAGGNSDTIIQDLFELDVQPRDNGGVPVGRPSTGNGLFYSEGSINRIPAPYGHGVLSEDRAGLTVVMRDAFDSAGSDMYLGFDSNERIELSGAARTAVDRDPDGVITWASGPGRVFVGPEHEAVVITTGGLLSTAELQNPNSATLSTLRQSLNVGGLDDFDSLLILARNEGGDSAMLLYFQDKDHNSEPNVDELTLIATFFNGVPETWQFTLG